MEYYKLGPDGRTPIPCKDRTEWMRWMQQDAARQRTVAATTLSRGVTVSTAFLGVRASAGDGLFETLVTGGGRHNNRTWKTQTWNAAETQHKAACKLVCAELPNRRQAARRAPRAQAQAARRAESGRER